MRRADSIADHIEVWDRVLGQARRFLRARGFREVSVSLPPALQPEPAPALEPLIAQGSGPVFCIGHGLLAWRDFRPNLDQVAADVTALVARCCVAAGAPALCPHHDRSPERFDSALGGHPIARGHATGAMLDVESIVRLALGEIAPVPAQRAPRLTPIRRAADVVAAGLATRAELDDLTRVEAQFHIAISPTMRRAISPRTDGPLARQFVPDARELRVAPEELRDPIGDQRCSPVAGVVHRYPDRVLLMPTKVCSVYCRFCFRREHLASAEDAVLAPRALTAALDYIGRNAAIWEVILTGGDPLILSPRRLGGLIAALDAIPHVRIIRVHTRVPLVSPEKITRALIAHLTAAKPVYIVLHTNHPDELTDAGEAACARLIDSGIVMLSQTVLLRSINDDVDTLAALMRRLVENRIKPYYLHQLDLARGTDHFRVPIERGRAIVRQLRGALSGLCQPTYVLDIPGGHGKVPIGPDYLHLSRAGYRVTDPWGDRHDYREPRDA